jgi:hypothetical protein
VLRKDIARIETRISQLRNKAKTDLIFCMAEIVKQPEAKRGNRKERVGEVVSNKMTKTIVVRVERRFPHPAIQEDCHRLQEILRARRKERGQGWRPCAHRGNAAIVENQMLAARGSRRARGSGNIGGGLI